MSTPNRLMSCPFCGSDKIRKDSRSSGHGESTAYVACECGARMEDYFGHPEKKWNTRAHSNKDSDACVKCGEPTTCPATESGEHYTVWKPDASTQNPSPEDIADGRRISHNAWANAVTQLNSPKATGRHSKNFHPDGCPCTGC